VITSSKNQRKRRPSAGDPAQLVEKFTRLQIGDGGFAPVSTSTAASSWGVGAQDFPAIPARP